MGGIDFRPMFVALVAIGVAIGFGLFVVLLWLWSVAIKPMLQALVA